MSAQFPGSPDSQSRLNLPWAEDEPTSPPSETLEPFPMQGTTAPRYDLPHLSAWRPTDIMRVLGWYFLRPAWITAYYNAGREAEVQSVAGWVTSTLLWLPLALPALGLTLRTIPSVEGEQFIWVLLALFLLWALCGWLAGHNSATVALMISSAAWIILTPIYMGMAGFRVGLIVAILFLALAGVAAGVAAVGSNRASIHLALGATFVVTVAALFRTYTFIAPIINAYVAGFVLGSIGGPILIAMAVIAAGLLALGGTYAIPYFASQIMSFVVEAVLEDGLESGLNMLGAIVLAGVVAAVMALAWISFGGGWRVVQML